MRKFIIIIVPIIFIGTVFFLSLNLINKDRVIIKGLRVAGVVVNETGKEDLKNKLEEKIENYKNSNILIKTDTQETQISVKNMGLIFDIDNTLNEATALGKEGGLVKRLREQAKVFIFKTDLPLSANFDRNIMAYFISNKLSDIHDPAKNISFIYDFDEKRFEFSSAKTGQIIDINEFQNKLLKNIGKLSLATINLKQYKDEPLVTSEGAEEAKNYAERIIEQGPYTIKTYDDSWKIEKDDLIRWIDFRPAFDAESKKYYLKTSISRARIQDYLTSFAPGLNLLPVNAEFEIQEGRVVVFNLANSGYNLDIAQSANNIASAIENLEKEASLEFIETLPSITEGAINNLKINAMLSRGETNFAGSPSARKHNIRLGSNQYQGLLIAPGEEFSFNKNLGEVTAAEGYLPELVIKQGKTIPEYGGGICQVSTTLFRAAVYAGLEITQRYNHSYVVPYYGTPGFDATIYPPNPDLAFKNNTPGYILIQYKIKGTRLIFEIYGQDDGRKVELEGPVVYDKKSDGSQKAWLKQIVKADNGDVLFEKTFYSNYKSPLLYPVSRNPFE